MKWVSLNGLGTAIRTGFQLLCFSLPHPPSHPPTARPRTLPRAALRWECPVTAAQS